MTKKRPVAGNQASVWCNLWYRLAPDDMRAFPVRHAAADGELRFAQQQLHRNWAFDWALPALKIAVEVDGGTHMAKWSPQLQRCVVVGRHNQDKDLEKHNAATMLGWLLFHFTPDMLTHTPQQCVDSVAQAVRLRRREHA